MTTGQIAAYLRPESLEEAWRLVREGGPTVRAVAGGTDLTIACPPEVTTLVDVRRAVDHHIVVAEDEVTIGAMATLTSMARHPTLGAYAAGVIPEMLAHVGSPLLRNACTIGGHLARGKLSDVIPVLLALAADVTVHTGRDLRLPLSDYYEAGLHQQPHLLTAVHLPAAGTGSAAAFERFARTAFDFPMANCCAVFADDGTVRIVVGGTPHRGQRARGAEEIVAAGDGDEITFAAAADTAAGEITTSPSWIASADYRTHLVRVLVRRCLEKAASRRAVP